MIIENFVVAMIAAPGCRLIMSVRREAAASLHNSSCDYSQWQVAIPTRSDAMTSVA